MQSLEIVLERRDSTVAKIAIVVNKAESSGKSFILSGSEEDPEPRRYKDDGVLFNGFESLESRDE